MFQIETVSMGSEVILYDIVHVIKASFPQQWVYEDVEQYYRQMLLNKDSVHIFLISGHTRVGYVHGIPHNDAVAELLEDDPLMMDDPLAYYIENVCIMPEYRGHKGIHELIAGLVYKCKEKFITKISLHARVSNGLSEKIKHNMKMITARKIDRWRYYNYEEPTEYMEVVAE